MKEFRLTREVLKDEEQVAEIAACVETMMLLKETEKHNHSVIRALLLAYLQLPIEEIDPEQKEQIAEVCTNLGKIFDCVSMSHLKFQTND